MTDSQPIRVAGVIANGQIDAQGDRFSPEALLSMERQINAAMKRGEALPLVHEFDHNRPLGTISEAKVADGKLFISAEVPPDFAGASVGVAGHTTISRGTGESGEWIIHNLILDSVSVVRKAVHPDYKLGGQELFPKGK